MLVNWKIILFLAHLCVLCTGSSLNHGVDYTYYPELNWSIKLHTEPTDWYSALYKCHGEKAYMVTWFPTWSPELFSVLSKLQADSRQLAVLYSGDIRTFHEELLTKVEGDVPFLIPARELSRLERCGVFLADGSTGEVSCTERLPFICYKPVTTSTPDPDQELEATEPESESSTSPQYLTDSTFVSVTASSIAQTFTDCGESSLGYEFSEQTGHCYKFHAQAVSTWYDAKVACEEEGAYLAVVNSDAEVKILTEIYAKYPGKKVFGPRFMDTPIDGFYVWETKKQNSNTMEQAGYTSWRPYGPLPRSRFGYTYINGVMSNYVYEIGDDSFICEKKPSLTRTIVKSGSSFVKTGFLFFYQLGNVFHYIWNY